MTSKYFNNPEANFQPNGKGLKAWLSTNKNPMNNAGVIRPGLFNEPSISSSLGFLLILVIEILATVWVKEEGMSVATIIGTIFIDICLAVASHNFEGKIIQAKNELLFNTNSLRGENVKATINRFSFCKNIFYILILASGLYKGLSFYFLYETFDSMTLCVVIAYLVAAVLHIYNTGYAWAYWRFKMTMDSQFNDFMNTLGERYAYDKDLPRRSAIEATQRLTEANTFKHAIVKDENGNYFFETKGVLLDTELSELISKQLTKEQQRIIAVEGVRLQCAQLTW
jgi:hypothetical protein